MRNFSVSVYINDAAQDFLSYLLSMSKLKSFKWHQKQIFNSMRFISKLEWRQPMKITVNFLTTHLHPKALSKWVELGHLARSYLKDLSQSFKMITSFCYVFLIAWMWNANKQVVSIFFAIIIRIKDACWIWLFSSNLHSGHI